MVQSMEQDMDTPVMEQPMVLQLDTMEDMALGTATVVTLATAVMASSLTTFMYITTKSLPKSKKKKKRQKGRKEKKQRVVMKKKNQKIVIKN